MTRVKMRFSRSQSFGQRIPVYRVEKQPGGRVIMNEDLQGITGDVLHVDRIELDWIAVVLWDQLLESADGLRTYILAVPTWALMPVDAEEI